MVFAGSEPDDPFSDMEFTVYQSWESVIVRK